VNDLWDTIKRPNIWIMDIEEWEEVQTKDTENLLNKNNSGKLPEPWQRDGHPDIGDF
jgi:PHD/YefM family antitoxin component YafN of YafNO toxin-antitoxin module